MFQSNQWQFWAIGAGLIVATGVTVVMQSPVPLVVEFVGVVILGAVVEERQRRRARQWRREEAIRRSSKVCPRCGRLPEAAAELCRFCGHEFGNGDGSGPGGG